MEGINGADKIIGIRDLADPGHMLQAYAKHSKKTKTKKLKKRLWNEEEKEDYTKSGQREHQRRKCALDHTKTGRRPHQKWPKRAPTKKVRS